MIELDKETWDAAVKKRQKLPKLESPAKPVIIRNLRANPMSVIALGGFDVVTLTERQASDERLMKRVNRAINIGTLERI